MTNVNSESPKGPLQDYTNKDATSLKKATAAAAAGKATVVDDVIKKATQKADDKETTKDLGTLPAPTGDTNSSVSGDFIGSLVGLLQAMLLKNAERTAKVMNAMGKAQASQRASQMQMAGTAYKQAGTAADDAEAAGIALAAGTGILQGGQGMGQAYGGMKGSAAAKDLQTRSGALDNATANPVGTETTATSVSNTPTAPPPAATDGGAGMIITQTGGGATPAAYDNPLPGGKAGAIGIAPSTEANPPPPATQQAAKDQVATNTNTINANNTDIQGNTTKIEANNTSIANLQQNKNADGSTPFDPSTSAGTKDNQIAALQEDNATLTTQNKTMTTQNKTLTKANNTIAQSPIGKQAAIETKLTQNTAAIDQNDEDMAKAIPGSAKMEQLQTKNTQLTEERQGLIQQKSTGGQNSTDETKVSTLVKNNETSINKLKEENGTIDEQLNGGENGTPATGPKKAALLARKSSNAQKIEELTFHNEGLSALSTNNQDMNIKTARENIGLAHKQIDRTMAMHQGLFASGSALASVGAATAGNIVQATSKKEEAEAAYTKSVEGVDRDNAQTSQQAVSKAAELITAMMQLLKSLGDVASRSGNS